MQLGGGRRVPGSKPKAARRSNRQHEAAPHDDQPCCDDGTWGGADPQLANDAEQHVSLLSAEAGACDGEFDGTSGSVFCRFFDTRADPDKMDRPPER